MDLHNLRQMTQLDGDSNKFIPNTFIETLTGLHSKKIMPMVY